MMKKFLFLTLIVLLTACGTGSKLSKEEREAQKAAQIETLKSMVEARKWAVEVGSMYANDGSITKVDYGHKLMLRGKDVVCALPYKGAGQNVGYGASGFKAMNFTSRYYDYQVDYPKKDLARIKFKTRNGDDEYDFQVEIYASGKASISAVPHGRDNISYSGALRAAE